VYDAIRRRLMNSATRARNPFKSRDFYTVYTKLQPSFHNFQKTTRLLSLKREQRK